MNRVSLLSIEAALRRTSRVRWGPPFVLLCALIVLGFILGGGSRDDIVSLLIWRPLSALGVALAVAWSFKDAWHNGRALLIYFGLVLSLILLHLLPLPPSIWTILPGREMIVDIYRDMGMALPWQPISMAQARTWNALFSILGPLAALILALALGTNEHRILLRVIIAIGVVSGMLGLLQAIGPLYGPLYFYKITNHGVAVGLFANRNHQALFLASMFPLLAAHLSLWSGQQDKWIFQKVVTFALALFFVPLLLVTGSRAGALLGVCGFALAWWVYHPPAVTGRRVAPTGAQRLIRLGVVGSVLVGILLLTIAAARAPALTRLISIDAADELRLRALPAIVEASGAFFPIGSGIGTFVETYRLFEPDELLSPQYLNHAHNDYLEVVMTAGVPGLLLMVGGLVMGAMGFWRLARMKVDAAEPRGRSSLVLGRAGLSALVLLALGSIIDYPLRVPSLALMAAVSAAWAANGYRHRRAAEFVGQSAL